MESEKVIEVAGLTKKFGKVIAVDNLNFSVYKGDVLGFLGPNGAGKSTTIRMMLSLIKPTSGEIKIFGQSIKQNRKNIFRRIGAIVEKPDFYLYLSAYRNLEILSKISGVKISRQKIMEILDIVGLSKRSNSKVKTFSHGMKQRLGIAQALLHDPELIILDEPTIGLDPQGMKEVRDIITYLSHEKNKTVFISSHILREIELIASRMIIINKGKAQVEGNVKDLLNSDILKVTFEVDDLMKAINLISNTLWKQNFISKERNELTFEMHRNDIALLNKYFIENGINVSAVIPIRSLEDYFLKITTGNS
ncbi:ABC transporter ATP-binding protein [Melioribacteraceae bacterium 4301-Me]|uniref:ABC transporter ATP-binding protein n=1 Tax=Pyranulibacter aquaticus TaxID=3163344 RepID=UPI00359C04E7